MEQILKIIKQLMGTGGMLGNVPKPIKMGVLYLTVFVGVLGIFKYANLDQSTKTFLIILLVLLALITAGYYAWKWWMQKQQNQQFGGDISHHSSKTPIGVDAGQRARLDDMRKKFHSGVDAYKSRGKDLYKLPWYVMVGEPGSGKTEAIRHSNVGFPPGMQDEFQGVGGTINMNWWFTNHAVVLDTAGRLMFEEVKPGETNEWKEFLGLLKKNRPNCPINGLFLVIPADSLIKDSADAIQKKAGKIAQQLDVIQRILDVRFPVFVAVTKCDKINGFREFFDGLTDPQLQHQMMGWSNPDPLDEPFKPELVDKHLEQVAARLRRRRLGLMRDPVPENPDGRRTDEVDSFYAFPHSLETLASRLRRYLETIFIAGEWSAKPLFLRGIYFSSSMREGAALDAELAEAIGVAVEELPEGKVWERERAYFLRDLFIEKVFREKGLVTRASNTKRMLRGQQIALYSSGFAALVAFSVVAWIAKGNLRSGVKDQGDYWQEVSKAGWQGNYWKQSIVPIQSDGSFAFAISTNPVVVDNKPVTLGEFHVKLRELTEKPMKKNFIFPGLASSYNKNSREAQSIVFEAGIVRPLLGATRQRMLREAADPGWDPRQAEALVALIQLEAGIVSRGVPTNKGELAPEGARKFLGTFENYIAGKDMPVDPSLVAVMAWTYSTNETAKGSWPPRSLSGVPRNTTNTLGANAGISAGLERFVRSTTSGFRSNLAEFSSVRDAARVFGEKESALFAAADARDANKFLEAHRAVQAARASLEEKLANASKQPLFSGGVLLAAALRTFKEGGAAFDEIRTACKAALALSKDHALFTEINNRLEMAQASLTKSVTQLLETEAAKEVQLLDEICLAEKSFLKRADLYARAEKLMDENPFARGTVVGSKGELLEKLVKERFEPLKTEGAAYTGKLKDKFINTLNYQLNRAEKSQTEKFFETYLAEAQRQLTLNGGFPLISDMSRLTTLDNFKRAGKQVKDISEDLVSPILQKYAPRDRPDWKAFVASIQGQQAVAKALFGEGILGACTISLAGAKDSPNDRWRDTWHDVRLICDGCNSRAIRTASEEEMGKAPLQQKIELSLIKNVNEGSNSAKFPISTPEWGSLWLIHKYKGTKVDPQTWLVYLDAPPESKGFIPLKLKFEGVLPELKDWPTQ